MYVPLVSHQDKDNLNIAQSVLVYTTNLNDLAISTNSKTVYYEIMQWYQSKTQRQFKEKKPKNMFIRYHGILEGARKHHVFGPFWIVTIVDKFLEIGCMLASMAHISANQISQLVFVTHKISNNRESSKAPKDIHKYQYRSNMF